MLGPHTVKSTGASGPCVSPLDMSIDWDADATTSPSAPFHFHMLSSCSMFADTTPKSLFPSMVVTSIDFVTVHPDVRNAVSGGSIGGTHGLATERIAHRRHPIRCMFSRL